MAFWLVKTESGDYSYQDLEKDKKTVWDGVTNNWALKNIREVKAGDKVLIYHTRKEKNIAGIGEFASDPYPDPHGSDKKLIVADVVPVKKLSGRVSLKILKSDPFFSDFMLVKFTRLSIMPVEKKYWDRILELEMGQ